MKTKQNWAKQDMIRQGKTRKVKRRHDMKVKQIMSIVTFLSPNLFSPIDGHIYIREQNKLGRLMASLSWPQQEWAPHIFSLLSCRFKLYLMNIFWLGIANDVSESAVRRLLHTVFDHNSPPLIHIMSDRRSWWLFCNCSKYITLVGIVLTTCIH